MKLTSGRSRRSPMSRCRAGGCSQEISDGLRRRTSLETAVLFMYDWCDQVNSIQNCERHAFKKCAEHCSDVESLDEKARNGSDIDGDSPDRRRGLYRGTGRDVIFEEKTFIS
uniref:Uncharacterized protein n=1 Tax=Trichuris muris TaxID=70415 RepID=A0A5S6QDF5_TRIMR